MVGGGLDGKWSTVNDGQQCVVAVVERVYCRFLFSHHPSPIIPFWREGRSKGEGPNGNRKQTTKQTTNDKA